MHYSTLLDPLNAPLNHFHSSGNYSSICLTNSDNICTAFRRQMWAFECTAFTKQCTCYNLKYDNV